MKTNTITKTAISVTLDKKLSDLIIDKFSNKSKYIEYLIYQDLLKNSTNEKIKNILI